MAFEEKDNSCTPDLSNYFIDIPINLLISRRKIFYFKKEAPARGWNCLRLLQLIQMISCLYRVIIVFLKNIPKIF